MDARIAPPFMEATDASRLVCVVVVSYQEYSLTQYVKRGMQTPHKLYRTNVPQHFISPLRSPPYNDSQFFLRGPKG